MKEIGRKMPRRLRRCRKRKCLHCREFFMPDTFNGWHQRYCGKPQCRLASKAASQQRWLRSEKGLGYFQGPENVMRVKLWRAVHPGYSQRKGSKSPKAVQDIAPAQPVEKQKDTHVSAVAALQDVALLQPALIIGLISSLTGLTLQDDIVATSRQFILSGQDILGVGLENKPQGGIGNGGKKSSLSATTASYSQTVQLGGSLPGS